MHFGENERGKQTMKTLKQILDEITPTPKRAFHDYLEIKESVKEWLTQYYHSEDDNEFGTGMWNAIIKRLILDCEEEKVKK